MERAVHRHYHLLRVTVYTSPPPNHRQRKPEKTRAHTALAMGALPALSLKSLPSHTTKITIATTQSHQTRPLGIRTQTKSMATEAPNKASQPSDSAPPTVAGKNGGAANGTEKPSPPPPPLPEKPLPGDCCGSGCVRCVWDVYYEELEEYNKLYKTDSAPNSKPSS